MGMRLPAEIERRILERAAKPERQPPETPAEQRQSEKAFMAQVVKLAKRNGWLVYHTYDSRKSQAGFPDLVLVRNCVVFAELKTETGKLTPEQEEWLARLRRVGEFAFCWRPSDFPEIERLLS